MAFWNSKNLLAPPTMSCKGYIKNEELEGLRSTLNEAIKYFREEQFMFAESVLLARIVYRFKIKFRSSKDLRSLVKVNQALKKYFSVKLTTSLKNFLRLLPKAVQDVESFLPTKNMLDHILVRLQGLAKLIERIFDTSKITAYELRQRINTGNFWKVAILILAVVSRLAVLAKHTAEYLCRLYDKLFVFRSNLNNTSTSWIPQDYTLPCNLKAWLNVKWIDEKYIPEAPSQKLRIIDFFDLVGSEDEDEVQFCDEYVLVDEDEDLEFIQEFKNVMRKSLDPNRTDNLLRGFSVDDDIGEILDIREAENISDQILKSKKLKKGKKRKESVKLNILIDSSDEDIQMNSTSLKPPKSFELSDNIVDLSKNIVPYTKLSHKDKESNNLKKKSKLISSASPNQNSIIDLSESISTPVKLSRKEKVSQKLQKYDESSNVKKKRKFKSFSTKDQSESIVNLCESTTSPLSPICKKRKLEDGKIHRVKAVRQNSNESVIFVNEFHSGLPKTKDKKDSIHQQQLKKTLRSPLTSKKTAAKNKKEKTKLRKKARKQVTKRSKKTIA